LTEAQQIVETWRVEYNESRPHRSLGEKTPTNSPNSRKLTLELAKKTIELHDRNDHWIAASERSARSLPICHHRLMATFFLGAIRMC
jgi:Integrase core domain